MTELCQFGSRKGGDIAQTKREQALELRVSCIYDNIYGMLNNSLIVRVRSSSFGRFSVLPVCGNIRTVLLYTCV